VNVADDGTPYEYIPPKNLNSRSDGRYVLHRNPKAAWWRLDLLSLTEVVDDVDHGNDPPGLEEFESYEFDDDVLPAPAARGRPR
jgi:hypothetical protein